MHDTLYELTVPVERNRDWGGYWLDKIAMAERRIEIAQECLGKLAFKDQLRLFDEL